ncbi:hypothetical protein Pmani_012009 [Petrolisthes manimaculis]|uniref:Coiled-coil domain-containing protein 86 n=1 Tax=Petrolisthes manimaculis TaxID=1843537 RepID=A0AAE1UAN9_9EUCA|nr:hypothetical protein Pmani_012009 [Petrolisthes manimaculis]
MVQTRKRGAIDDEQSPPRTPRSKSTKIGNNEKLEGNKTTSPDDQPANKRRSVSSSSSQDTNKSSALQTVVSKKITSGVSDEGVCSPRPLRQSSRRLSAMGGESLPDLNLPSTPSKRSAPANVVTDAATPSKRSTRNNRDVQEFLSLQTAEKSSIKRSRGRPRKNVVEVNEDSDDTSNAAEKSPIKSNRGRPRKNVVEVDEDSDDTSNAAEKSPIKSNRGRPRKNYVEVDTDSETSNSDEEMDKATKLNSVKKKSLSEATILEAGNETPKKRNVSLWNTVLNSGLMPVVSLVRADTPTRASTRRRSVINSDAAEEVNTPTKTRARRTSIVDVEDTPTKQAANRKSVMEAEFQTPTKQSTRGRRKSITVEDPLVNENTPTRRSTRRNSITVEDPLISENRPTPTRRSTRRSSIIDLTEEPVKMEDTPTRRSSRRKSIIEIEVQTPTRSSTRRKSSDVMLEVPLKMDIGTPTRRTSARGQSLVGNDSKDVNKDVTPDKKSHISTDILEEDSDTSDTSVFIPSGTTRTGNKSTPVPLTPVRRSRRRSGGLEVESEFKDSGNSGNSLLVNETTVTVDENDSGKVLPVIEEEVETSFTENSETEVLCVGNEKSVETTKVNSPITQKVKVSDMSSKDKVKQSPSKDKMSKSPIQCEGELELKLDEDSSSEGNLEVVVVPNETITPDQNCTDNNNEKIVAQKNQDEEIVDNVTALTCTVDNVTPVKGQKYNQEELPDLINPDKSIQSKSKSPKSIILQSTENRTNKPANDNDKENEPVIADQTVSTTDDLKKDSCKVKEGGEAETEITEPTVALDDLPTSTTTTSNNLHVPAVTENLENNDSNKTNTQTNKTEVIKELTDIEMKLVQIKSIPRGLPESGRFWKSEKNRFSSIMKNNTGMRSWNKKMQRKKEREEVMAKFAAIESEKQQKKEKLKERQKFNKIRREENERKSEIVQVIKDSRKVKKMKKKQLRYISTRDTTNM